MEPGGQWFVISELNDIDIVEGNIDDLKEVYKRFEADFAANEIKDYDHLELLLSKKKYKLLLAKHKVFEEMIGYAFIYEPDELKVLWLDYLAIETKYQNLGYGTYLFNKIAEFKREGTLGIFLEVEIPDGTDGSERSNQLRRIKFYERLGCKKIHINYEYPTKDGGFPMYLYFWPSSNLQVLPKEQTKETIISAFDYIHSDVGNRDDIIKKFQASIEDEYFHK
jgi:ribosomal protein S18 acetylase RimI-like enzyme